MHEIADFLSRYEPFADLAERELNAVAGAVEIEFFARGEGIVGQGEEPMAHVRMIRRGAVELLDRGRPLDLLGEGEMFGHPSMLAWLPTGVGVRAQEDTVCYRLPEDIVLPLLTRPAGLRFVARSLLARPWQPPERGDLSAADPARRRVGAFVNEPLVMCRPSASVRDVARDMAGRGASCAVVALRDDGFGILTDQDLRVRVVGGDVPPEAEVTQAMSAPAYTVSPLRRGIDVLIEMIDRGIRHVPVVSERGEVLGVVTDVDLVASDTRTSFMVRRGIARASSLEQLTATAAPIRPTVIALHDARVASADLAAIIAAFADALTRRALELLLEDAGDVPPFAWLATGSIGRREAFPSSDIDCALAWEGTGDGTPLRRVARLALDALARCGFATDPHAATAAHPLFSRSADEWRVVIGRWLDRPEDARLLIVLSVLEDARQVFSRGTTSDPLTELRAADDHPELLGQLRLLALSHRPPTGFLRDIVVEHSGEHRGRLDIKKGGLLPVVDLARYGSFVTATTATATPDRLRAAAEAGVFTGDEATTMIEAFELFTDLRMRHQVDQMRRGEAADDFIDPAELNPLMRRYLREAFRSIARTQRDLAPGAFR